jgi:Zn finger protein HypA/HybF involved in hydrogenase expression
LHEFSLVQGIIDAVLATAEKERGKVLSFEVRVGELAQFDLRLVRALLNELKMGTPLETSKVVVRRESSKVRCLGCGSVWGFKDIVRPMSDEEREIVHFFPELLNSHFRCPACSKSYLEIEEGRSVRIAGVCLDV